MGGGAKERFAEKFRTATCGNKADGGKAVLQGERFGLLQGLAGDGGHMRRIAIWRDVKGQCIDRIGRRAVQRCAGGLAPGGLVQSAGVDCQVFDLLVGNDQLGAERAGGDRLSALAQGGEGRWQGRVGHRHLAQAIPPARSALQQADPVEGQGQRKIRLHGRPLASLARG